jgi:Aldehyde dehydrogenase family
VLENVELASQNIPSLTQAADLAVLSPEQQREVAETTDFAIAAANDSSYGLSGSVWTADPEHGYQVAA